MLPFDQTLGTRLPKYSCQQKYIRYYNNGRKNERYIKIQPGKRIIGEQLNRDPCPCMNCRGYGRDYEANTKQPVESNYPTYFALESKPVLNRD